MYLCNRGRICGAELARLAFGAQSLTRNRNYIGQSSSKERDCKIQLRDGQNARETQGVSVHCIRCGLRTWNAQGVRYNMWHERMDPTEC